MNVIKLFSILLFLQTGITLHAQSLIDKLGGIKTNYTIVSDFSELQTTLQAIVKRGVSNVERSSESSSAYGFQTYHLEFTTTSKITKYYRRAGISKKMFYELKLLDANNKPLLITTLEASEVSFVSNKEGLYTYSLNLKKIPLILLDKAKYINILKISSRK